MHAGTSLDQIYAQKFGQDTPIPSMQLCIENVDQAGGCSYGYSCAYTDTISWASPTEPLPMIRDPRAVFDQLFGVGATPERARGAGASATRASSTGSRESVERAEGDLGAARSRRASSDYLDDVREIERRIQKVEARNTSGEARELPAAPVGVPDSFDEHVKLMFDLQALAFAADMTRVFSFKMGRDVVEPRLPGERRHHRLPHRVASRRHARTASPTSRKINTLPRQPAAVLPREAEEHAGRRRQRCSTTRWSSTDRRWATRTSTTTSAARCSSPGTPAARCKGNMHLKAADGTPMANAMLSVAAARSACEVDELRRQQCHARPERGRELGRSLGTGRLAAALLGAR